MSELVRICQKIKSRGNRALLVGGAVRDMCLGLSPKDLDVEVFGLGIETLEQILTQFGTVDVVGRSFGVLKLTTETNNFDFSLPRRDNKTGQGHKGFIVESDPDMTLEEAAARRDFTINSMSFDPLTEEIIDPFNGKTDLLTRVLTATSDHFSEDPLRVLRGFQFAARFGLKIERHTRQLCTNLYDEFHSLPKERIWEEWKKWALKGKKPSMGLDVLDRTIWIDHFPELEKLIGLPQNPEWHPEGDVWSHTRQAVDVAARLCEREHLDENDRLIMIFAALCHDMGKPSTTKFVNDKIISHGHDKAGKEPTISFMSRIGAPQWLVDRIVPLVTNHMIRRSSVDTPRAVRRLAERLAPASIQELMWLVEIDGASRYPAPPFKSWSIDRILELARSAGCEESPVSSILMGRHLIELGMIPSPEFGQILGAAREAQLNGEFDNLEGALLWAKRPS